MWVAMATSPRLVTIAQSHNNGRRSLLGIVDLDHWKRLELFRLTSLAEVEIVPNGTLKTDPNNRVDITAVTTNAIVNGLRILLLKRHFLVLSSSFGVLNWSCFRVNFETKNRTVFTLHDSDSLREFTVTRNDNYITFFILPLEVKLFLVAEGRKQISRCMLQQRES